ncbi:MAG: hypothetical protein PCALPYG88_1732 [uncultured Paraburkholderia sp.]|uniref:hypothetical protein n=1 Tax=uncultured Paraburkholderia sp. TaxID=1822466 RepID=UPI002595EC02|nr:hypothetical protein [uncultured Paraburkholderia sp.]CAH2901127.1 MAG: hypothetical protein PCALPYG08_5112 [uncultured Paraburkholderia sp.]CAH2916750.1 MAG: hypothetical protein PCALPYG88_1732 [uncultured Paraburkholderia sp.]
MTTPSETWPKLDLSDGTLARGRAVPHAFIRSALFSSRKFSGDAVRVLATETNPIPISAQENYKLRQVAGERLDQGDCDVYVWLLNRAYKRGLEGKTEARIYFTRGEALKELGRARGTKSFQLLDESLMRLYQADIAYEIPNAIGRTRLISSVEKPRKEANKNFDYEVVVSAKAGDFLRGEDFKVLYHVERDRLGDYLSRWLHAFYSSHNNPYQLTTDFIQELADRTSIKQESKWRALLDKALANVKEVTGWAVCEVREYENVRPRIVVTKGKREPRRPKSKEENHDI